MVFPKVAWASCIRKRIASDSFMRAAKCRVSGFVIRFLGGSVFSSWGEAAGSAFSTVEAGAWSTAPGESCPPA